MISIAGTRFNRVEIWTSYGPAESEELNEYTLAGLQALHCHRAGRENRTPLVSRWKRDAIPLSDTGTFKCSDPVAVGTHNLALGNLFIYPCNRPISNL